MYNGCATVTRQGIVIAETEFENVTMFEAKVIAKRLHTANRPCLTTFYVEDVDGFFDTRHFVISGKTYGAIAEID